MSQLTAEEIFKNHGCLSFHIHREGMWDEYVRLGGNNRRLEKKWRAEYINEWYNKIDSEPFQAACNLGSVGAVEIIDDLIKLSNFKDDYAKFWYSSMLIDIANGIYLNPFKRIKVKNKARKVLNELLRKDIELSDKSKEAITKEMQYHLNATTAEEYIRNYSLRLISKK